MAITPRTIRKKRRKVAGVSVNDGGFALLSAHDYNAYRMAHDLGIVVYSVDHSLSPAGPVPDRRHRDGPRLSGSVEGI